MDNSINKNSSLTAIENITSKDTPNRVWIKLPIREIVTLYNAGTSINALAKQFRVSRPTITNRLELTGIKLRNQSESETLKWNKMSPEMRENQVEAAHEASKGRVMPIEEKIKRARTVEKRLYNVSPYEITLAEMLLERRIKTIPQKAIGPYNCDLAAFPVAVEVFGGNWHWSGRHLRRIKKRINYILNAGWSVYMIPVTASWPLTDAVADYCAAYIEQARSDKAFTCEYRVVWGAGKFETAGTLDDDDVSIEPPFGRSKDLATGRYKTVPR